MDLPDQIERARQALAVALDRAPGDDLPEPSRAIHRVAALLGDLSL